MLQNHLARHRGERSHKCSHCEKSFYTATDLKVNNIVIIKFIIVFIKLIKFFL